MLLMLELERRVLPELKFRPSLSVRKPRLDWIQSRCVAGTKVPALIERSSSAPRPEHRNGVAGTKVPALIERPFLRRGRGLPRRVAGTKVPALIERGRRMMKALLTRKVLPELKFRPSLSAGFDQPPGGRS